MIDTAADLAPRVGVVHACNALNVSRSSYYRQSTSMVTSSMTPAIIEPHTVSAATPQPHRLSHPRALPPALRQEILEVCAADRFIDRSVAHVFATLLDEGVYLASRLLK
jgi:putative transposase